MNVFFTSDTHLGHTRIMQYCNRPFSTVEEMDETIITRWNGVVRPGDTVYHLGDFAFTKTVEQTEAYLKRLNGQKFLVLGNHDRDTVKKAKGFVWQRDLTKIKVGKVEIVLCHYAMRVWNKSHHGSWQLYGHSHGTLSDDPNARSVDVGVDRWDFTPVSLEQLVEIMKKKNFVAVDHHEEEKR